MNNNDSETRNFETVQSQGSSSQKNAVAPKKVVAISIFAVAIAIVVLFCAVIITEIAYKINGYPDDDPGVTPPVHRFDRIDVTVSSADVEAGWLLVVTPERKLNDSIASRIEASITDMKKYNNELLSSSSDANLISHYTYGSGDYRLTKETIRALNRLTNALSSEMSINDVLIAFTYSTDIDNDYDVEHVIGTVVDIKREDGVEISGTVLEWMNAHCYEYGLINSDPSGAIHDAGNIVKTTQFRYVGLPHAKFISENELTVEEYVNELKTAHNSPDTALSISVSDESTYLVYYLSQDSEKLSVPSNYVYTISDDNMGGYIVTVDLSKELR